MLRITCEGLVPWYNTADRCDLYTGSIDEAREQRELSLAKISKCSFIQPNDQPYRSNTLRVDLVLLVDLVSMWKHIQDCVEDLDLPQSKDL